VRGLGFAARGAVIAAVEMRLGAAQAVTGRSERLGGDLLRAGGFGRVDRLPGIAHRLDRRARARREQPGEQEHRRSRTELAAAGHAIISGRWRPGR
jgi:hypothetical protein